MELGERLRMLGPGRRSECTVLEQQIVLADDECAALSDVGESLPSRLGSLFAAGGGPQLEALHWSGSEAGPEAAFGELYARLGLALQRAAGHRVAVWGVQADTAGRGVWAWFEFEHDEVGDAASRLALDMLCATMPALRPPVRGNSPTLPANAGWPEFLAFAQPLVLPRDTEALLSAARARGIPCFKLERAPYQGLAGPFRIRPNGLVSFGHCAHKRIVDGTLSIDRADAVAPLLKNATARHAALQRLGLPLARPGEAPRGPRFQLLLAGAQLVAVMPHDGVNARAPTSDLHPATLKRLQSLAQELDSGLLLVELACTDPRRPLEQQGGTVVDAHFAPNLDRELDGLPEVLRSAAEAFVDWLYPSGAPSRIPVAAVTGTNGKTTTSRMIERIAREAGLRTGLDCSDGLYFDGQRAPEERQRDSMRFYPIFEHPELEFAVLEEYFGVVLRAGFANTFSDVAVCTNVTNDHLGRIGIHSLEQMAEVKRLVVSRAREGAVLNADDPLTLAMIPQLEARRLGLVSRRRTAAELAAAADRPALLCVLEVQDEANWLVVYDGEQRLPLMPETAIPATLGGAAAHNTCNAMQAALAALLLGFDRKAVRTALAGFAMGFADTPGRLNLFRGLPFSVLMDYAHNEDGFRALVELTDRLQVQGRRILMVGYTDDRRDAEILSAARVLAGHFDHYLCRNFRKLRDTRRTLQDIPRLLRQGLLEGGASPDMIDIVPVADDATDAALALVREGDLLVMLLGSEEFAELWGRLESLRSEGQAQASAWTGIQARTEAVNPSV